MNRSAPAARKLSDTQIVAMVEDVIARPFTGLGMYPRYLLTRDGEPLSPKAAEENLAEIRAAHSPDTDPTSSWAIAGQDVNYEDANLSCSHLSIPIECAYPPDPDMVKAAEHWLSGQDSGLYRITCNGGIPDLNTARDALSEIETILAAPEAERPKTVSDRVDYEALGMLLAECKEYIVEHDPDAETSLTP